MNWNYRMVQDATGYYALHEVYYNARGLPTSCTKRPCTFGGDTNGEVLRAIETALRDAKAQAPLYHPIMWAKDDD